MLIPSIPQDVDLTDLWPNGKLYSEAQIAVVMQWVSTLNSAPPRISKREINEALKAYPQLPPVPPVKFHLQKAGDHYNIIYFGKKGEKVTTSGKGSFGKVKWSQNLHTAAWSDVTKIIRKTNSRSPSMEIGSLQAVGQHVANYERKNKLHKEQVELVMLRAAGVSLASISKRAGEANTKREKIMPAVRWLDLSIQMLKKTQELHNNNILHRDIKDRNMHYDVASGKLLILDYGLSILNVENISKGIRKPDDISGTPGFVAPEVYNGRYSEKTEVYALGVTLARVLNLGDLRPEPFDNRLSLLVYRPSDDKYFNTYQQLDPLVRNVVTEYLKKMTSYDSFARPTIAEAIQFFNGMRNNYLSAPEMTLSVAYLDADEYDASLSTERTALIEKLKKYDVVWILQKESLAENKSFTHAKIMHELNHQGIAVRDEAILYPDNQLIDIMRNYAAQREDQDEYVYDCHYVTKMDSTAIHKISDSQREKILDSLKNDINRLKTNAAGDQRIALIQQTINEINAFHTKGELTFLKIYSMLSNLQSQLLDDPACKNSLQTILQELRAASKALSKLLGEGIRVEELSAQNKQYISCVAAGFATLAIVDKALANKCRDLLIANAKDAESLAKGIVILHNTDPSWMNKVDLTDSTDSTAAENFASILIKLYRGNPNLIDVASICYLSEVSKPAEVDNAIVRLGILYYANQVVYDANRTRIMQDPIVTYLLVMLFRTNERLMNEDTVEFLVTYPGSKRCAAQCLMILHKANEKLVNKKSRELLKDNYQYIESILKALETLYQTDEQLVNEANLKLLFAFASTDRRVNLTSDQITSFIALTAERLVKSLVEDLELDVLCAYCEDYIRSLSPNDPESEWQQKGSNLRVNENKQDKLTAKKVDIATTFLKQIKLSGSREELQQNLVKLRDLWDLLLNKKEIVDVLLKVNNTSRFGMFYNGKATDESAFKFISNITGVFRSQIAKGNLKSVTEHRHLHRHRHGHD